MFLAPAHCIQPITLSGVLVGSNSAGTVAIFAQVSSLNVLKLISKKKGVPVDELNAGMSS